MAIDLLIDRFIHSFIVISQQSAYIAILLVTGIQPHMPLVPMIVPMVWILAGYQLSYSQQQY